MLFNVWFSNILQSSLQFFVFAYHHVRENIYCLMSIRLFRIFNFHFLFKHLIIISMLVTEYFIKYSNHSLYQTNARCSHCVCNHTIESFDVIYYASHNWWPQLRRLFYTILMSTWFISIQNISPVLPSTDFNCQRGCDASTS